MREYWLISNPTARMYALSWIPMTSSVLKWVKMNLRLALSLATAGINTTRTMLPITMHQLFRRGQYLNLPRFFERERDEFMFCTCGIPECSKFAHPRHPPDGEAVDQPVYHEDGTVDGQHHVLGGHVSTAVGSSRAQQDDHLDKLSQRVVYDRRASPLQDRLIINIDNKQGAVCQSI